MLSNNKQKPKKTTKFMIQAQSLYLMLLSIVRYKKILVYLLPIQMGSFSYVAIV